VRGFRSIHLGKPSALSLRNRTKWGSNNLTSRHICEYCVKAIIAAT
jgi:hypothetical protein